MGQYPKWRIERTYTTLTVKSPKHTICTVARHDMEIAYLIKAAPLMKFALQWLNENARPENWDDPAIAESERKAWRLLDLALANSEPQPARETKAI